MTRLVHRKKIDQRTNSPTAFEENLVDGNYYQLRSSLDETGFFRRRDVFSQVSVRGWNMGEESYNFEMSVLGDGKLIFLYRPDYQQAQKLSESDRTKVRLTDNDYLMLETDNF